MEKAIPSCFLPPQIEAKLVRTTPKATIMANEKVAGLLGHYLGSMTVHQKHITSNAKLTESTFHGMQTSSNSKLMEYQVDRIVT